MPRGLVLSYSDGEPLKTFKYESDLRILLGKWSVDEEQSTKARGVQVEELNKMSPKKKD